MSWVLRNSEETLGSRLVLLVLADHASDDGTGAWPSVDTIAREARMTRRAVQYALRGLEERGAIVAAGKSKQGTVIYDVWMETPMGAQNLRPGGADDDTGGAQSTTRGGATAAPEPSLKQPSEGQPSTDTARAREGIAVGGTEYTAPASVDRKPVTIDEAQQAAVVLHIWNRETGQQLRAKEWIGKIIMRLREYPEATAADHGFIIRTALAHPWWRGDPSPSVVYGNGAQFERAITEARRRATEGDDDDRIARIVQAAQERRAS